MSSHEHHEHSSSQYDPKYGRKTLIGIGIFVLIMALTLGYVDSKLVASKSSKPEAHSSVTTTNH